MAAATFILIHKQPRDPAAAREALKFFAWAYDKGDDMAEGSTTSRCRRRRRERREDVDGRSRTRAASRSSHVALALRRRALSRSCPARPQSQPVQIETPR